MPFVDGKYISISEYRRTSTVHKFSHPATGEDEPEDEVSESESSSDDEAPKATRGASKAARGSAAVKAATGASVDLGVAPVAEMNAQPGMGKNALNPKPAIQLPKGARVAPPVSQSGAKSATLAESEALGYDVTDPKAAAAYRAAKADAEADDSGDEDNEAEAADAGSEAGDASADE